MSEFLTLNDGRKLGFIDGGKPEGLPVFLFHGTPGSRIFGFEEEPLVQKEGLRIITPERPGYGLSDAKKNRELRDYCCDIEQLADHLDIEQFHVSGVSGGGPYALACANWLSNRVLTVTLIASATPVDMKGFSKGMSAGNRLAFSISRYIPSLLKPIYLYSSWVVRKKPEKLIEGLESQLCQWDRNTLNELKANGKIEIFLAHIREAYRNGYFGAYSDMLLLAKPWKIDFQSLSVPIIMWHGEADTLMPITPAKAFSKILPGCECHFIKDAGHLLLESEEFSRQIISRLKAHPPDILSGKEKTAADNPEL